MSALVKYFWTLDEILSLIRFRLGHNFLRTNTLQLGHMSPCLQQCYQLLYTTGRSFGLLINVLDQELRNSTCILYLLLRAMDTIEDDMTIPNETKVSILNSFDKLILDPTWKYSGSKDEYAVVLDNFPIISQALHQLPKQYTDVIVATILQFAKGTASFVGREIVSMEDFNKYSYFAAAVFCIGVVRLFIISGLEDETLSQNEASLVQFSLFLHKANFIKDFWKDFKSGRLYWPKEVWSKYVRSPEDLLQPKNGHKAVECLNELVTDALGHLQQCLHYADRMKSSSSRRLYEINKVMAIASLERCYNNPEVFTKAVKIRRGEAAKIILRSTSQRQTMELIRQYIINIMNKTSCEDLKDVRIRETCLLLLTNAELQTLNKRVFQSGLTSFLCTCLTAVVVVGIAIIVWCLLF